MVEKKERIVERIKAARTDRARIQSRLNDFYDLAVPHRPRVGTRLTRHIPDQNKQDDIFDQTLQQAVLDFAADQIDFFTPDYKAWTLMKPGRGLSAGGERKFSEEIKRYEERLYDLIRETDFYEQQQEVFVDLAGAAGGMNIPFAPVTKPVRCQPILMGSLLFDEGPHNDLDGRWQEFFVRKEHLPEVFPEIDFNRIQTIQGKTGAHDVHIVQGIYRDYENARWVWCVLADEKLAWNKPLPEGAPPSISIARWRHAPPSPWGPGPADPAMPAARTLDELGYLNLKKLAKEADPPYSFEADGTFNPDGGINAGTFLARRSGSKAPEPLYFPTNNQNLFFDREILQMIVKRALFQDGPFQRGETPPTATQWLDEKAMHQRRQIARRRIYREYVLPVLQRFAWVFAARGELPPVRIDGETIAVEFVSPLSKASDAEEVSSGIQLVQAIVGTFGETGLASIDAFETSENWKDKLGDTTVVLTKPDDQQALIQKLLTEGRNIAKGP